MAAGINETSDEYPRMKVEGISTGRLGADTRRDTIADEITSTQKALAVLHETLSGLEDRLQPILSETERGDVGEDDKRPGGDSPVLEDLRSMRGTISHAASRIAIIQNRIQL